MELSFADQRRLSPAAGRGPYGLVADGEMAGLLPLHAGHRRAAPAVQRAGSTAANFDLSPLTFRQPGRGMVLAATRPITPTWFSETRLGYSMNRLTSSPDLPDKISKSKLGLDLPQWRPALNPSGFIPNVTFGGLGTSPNMSMNTAMPYKNVNHIFSATQNFSKISGTHTVRTRRVQQSGRAEDQIQGTNTRGSMSFSDDANNPDAHPLRLRQRADGHHDQLHRSDGDALRTVPVHRTSNGISRTTGKRAAGLTLDYGVRFYHDAGQEEVRGQTAAFVQSMYNPANAPVLITSGRNAANARVGVDPLTGKQYNIAFIGTFAPGHGDPSIGMVSRRNEWFSALAL